MRAAAVVVLVFAVTGGLACTTWGGRAPDEAAPYDGALRVRPDPVVFEDTSVGCRRVVTLELENADAAAPLRVTSAVTPHEALRVAGPLPLALPAGGRRLLDLHFAPESPGDRSGRVGLATDEGAGKGGALYRLETTARAVGPERAREGAPAAPLDLVFVLDVSTTMDETAGIRAAVAEGLGADADAEPAPDVRLGLVTFVNDVHVHRGGAFLDRATFLEELDTQLLEDPAVPDPALPRQTLNFDLAENVLDALYRAATGFAFRPDARRYALLLTDATFREPPAVFSGGIPALHSFAETGDALEAGGVRLFAVHAGHNGGGLSASWGGRPSLVSRTGGAWFELADVEAGTLTLDGILRDLVVGEPCR